jgi:hypothetical protein
MSLPIVLKDAQLQQIKLSAFQIPYALRGVYLRRLAELLPKEFGDADVWRASHQAAREVMHAPGRRIVAAPVEGCGKPLTQIKASR